MKQKVKNYAGLLSRFLALTIDFLIFCVIFFPMTRIVKGVWIMSPVTISGTEDCL